MYWAFYYVLAKVIMSVFYFLQDIHILDYFQVARVFFLFSFFTEFLFTHISL